MKTAAEEELEAEAVRCRLSMDRPLTHTIRNFSYYPVQEMLLLFALPNFVKNHRQNNVYDVLLI